MAKKLKGPIRHDNEPERKYICTLACFQPDGPQPLEIEGNIMVKMDNGEVWPIASYIGEGNMRRGLFANVQQFCDVVEQDYLEEKGKKNGKKK